MKVGKINYSSASGVVLAALPCHKDGQLYDVVNGAGQRFARICMHCAPCTHCAPCVSFMSSWYITRATCQVGLLCMHVSFTHYLMGPFQNAHKTLHYDKPCYTWKAGNKMVTHLTSYKKCRQQFANKRLKTLSSIS